MCGRGAAFYGILIGLVLSAVQPVSAAFFDPSRFAAVKTSVDSLTGRARSLTYVDPAEAVRVANLALEAALPAGYRSGTAHAYRALASVYIAEDYFFQAVELLRTAEAMFEAEQDSLGLANCYISYGHMYRRLGQREKEVFFHRKSYEIFNRLGSRERQGVTLHNLSESLLLSDSLPSARQLALQSIWILEEDSNLSVLSNAYKVLGKIERREGNETAARKHFETVLELTNRLAGASQKIATVETLLELADMEARAGRPAEERARLEEAFGFCRTYNLKKYMLEVADRLTAHFAQTGNGRAMMQFQNESAQIRAAIEKQLQTDRVQILERALEARKLMEQNDELRRTAEAEAREARTRTRLLGAAGVILMLLIAFGVQRARAARRLEILNSRLEESRATIAEQNRRLEELNLTKDRFFSIVAHDLRTPLYSLKTFSALIESDIDHLEKADIASMARALSASIDNTTAMADHLITWALIQMKETGAQPVEFDAALRAKSICSVYEGIAAGKSISLENNLPPGLPIRFDPDQFEFILRNLVANAVKYTGPGGRITLSAESAGEQVVIRVTDTGTGMSPETLERLFDPARKRSMPGTAGEKGTGLGLMLVREFARMNGAAISVESTKGAGSTFTLRIPA